jgi:hypothetical protein
MKLLNKYFSDDIWKPTPIEEWKYSGLELINKIEPHEYVIDVGCGYNMFKDKIPNLLGIDSVNDEANIKISIEEFSRLYRGDKFDVALCLGSINFGDKLVITKQISKIVSILKDTSRIYWRCNPNSRDHDNDMCAQINFFPWSEEWMIHFAKLFNYKINYMKYEPNKVRLYCEWKRT